MSYAKELARLRREKGYTQTEVADYVSRFAEKPYSVKAVSRWENGDSMPPVDLFLLLCEHYGVKDIQATFRGSDKEFRNLSQLNELGKSRVEEYIGMLMGNPLFSDSENADEEERPISYLRLYDIPVAAGTGSFLDSDDYEELEIDETIPDEADFAVKVSGNSMEPRFVDKQIIFIMEQSTLDIGEIGIFSVNGDAFVKKLGQGE